MKITKKLFLFLVLIITFGMNILTVEARIPLIYPVWGYDTQDHICQIKQESKESPIREELTGDYWNMRECRYDNPEIIFHTGSGILVWFGILLFALLLHYFIFPKFKKRTKAEKVIFFLQDTCIIGIVLFFLMLLQHYFYIPRAVYPYPSDIDHIIYSTFIRAQVPIIFAGFYVMISLVRVFFKYQKNK